jgi:hypothetical protein
VAAAGRLAGRPAARAEARAGAAREPSGGSSGSEAAPQDGECGECGGPGARDWNRGSRGSARGRRRRWAVGVRGLRAAGSPDAGPWTVGPPGAVPWAVGSPDAVPWAVGPPDAVPWAGGPPDAGSLNFRRSHVEHRGRMPMCRWKRRCHRTSRVLGGHRWARGHWRDPLAHSRVEAVRVAGWVAEGTFFWSELPRVGELVTSGKCAALLPSPGGNPGFLTPALHRLGSGCHRTVAVLQAGEPEALKEQSD